MGPIAAIWLMITMPWSAAGCRSARRLILRCAPSVAPKVNLRPAEQVSVSAVLGFLVAGAMLVLVLMSYVQLTALSDSVVSLQKELTTLQTENVTLTTAYERAFDLETVESAARAAGMSKPSTSQIYYLIPICRTALRCIPPPAAVRGRFCPSLGTSCMQWWNILREQSV